MNVVIITVLLIASFVSIYIVTRSNVYSEIDRDFRRISYTWDDVMTNIGEEGYDFNIESFNNYLGITENYDFLESRLANSYYLVADSSKILTKAVGFYDIDYRILGDILDGVNWSSEEIQYLTHKDIHFAYRIRESSDGSVIKFMNISKRLGVLTNLIFTSLVIFMITMVFVVIISIYMTNKSIKPLDEAYKRQKQFISDASHELRTPLASINANTDLILSKNYIRPAEKKWLDYIKAETLRMSNLTRDLLYLAELDEQASEERDNREFDLSYIAKTYTLGMEAMAFEKNLILQKNIDENIKISGDSEKISQLFVILLENALRFTPEGGSVTLSLKKQRNYIELTVSNTGSYIPLEQTKRIFDRFYRIDQSRSGKAESHGLGLSIAKSIVERHGGSIACTSEQGGLTSFIVKFNNI
jgi:signal transduction histidine kinase